MKLVTSNLICFDCFQIERIVIVLSLAGMILAKSTGLINLGSVSYLKFNYSISRFSFYILSRSSFQDGLFIACGSPGSLFHYRSILVLLAEKSSV